MEETDSKMYWVWDVASRKGNSVRQRPRKRKQWLSCPQSRMRIWIREASGDLRRQSFVWWLQWAGVKGIDDEVSPDSLKAGHGGETVFAGAGVPVRALRVLGPRPSGTCDGWGAGAGRGGTRQCFHVWSLWLLKDKLGSWKYYGILSRWRIKDVWIF